jgi:hypothetical protein
MASQSVPLRLATSRRLAASIALVRRPATVGSYLGWARLLPNLTGAEKITTNNKTAANQSRSGAW